MINAVIERCAGINVGKKFIVACVMTEPAIGEARSEERQFGTTVTELQRARARIVEQGCTHIILEGTGAYRGGGIHQQWELLRTLRLVRENAASSAARNRTEPGAIS